MKTLSLLIVLALAVNVSAATTKAKILPNTTTSEIKTESVNSSRATTTTDYALKSNPRIHFSANMLGLLNGKPNVNANFFIAPKIALSVTFANESEKTTPIKKSTVAPGTKLTVSTTHFGVGAAFYFFPMEQKWNLLANPYLVTEKKSDPLETESNLGFGLKADGIYLINSLALGAGLQATSISGNTNTIVNAGVGYLF